MGNIFPPPRQKKKIDRERLETRQGNGPLLIFYRTDLAHSFVSKNLSFFFFFFFLSCVFEAGWLAFQDTTRISVSGLHVAYFKIMTVN